MGYAAAPSRLAALASAARAVVIAVAVAAVATSFTVPSFAAAGSMDSAGITGSASARRKRATRSSALAGPPRLSVLTPVGSTTTGGGRGGSRTSTRQRRGSVTSSPPLVSAAFVFPAASPSCAHRRPITAFAMAGGGDSKYFMDDEYIRSNDPAKDLRVPNYDAIFDAICEVSPLAKQALCDDDPRGFDAISEKDDVHQWKLTNDTPRRLVSRIEKIDNYQQKGVPIVRFRSKLVGPKEHRGYMFGELIQNYELRQKWDMASAGVNSSVEAASFDEVKETQRRLCTNYQKLGEPALFGLGYCTTKQSVVSPREQLTLCGLQNFESGASMIWGVELPVDQNYLFPDYNDGEGKRLKRSTSHLFSVAMVPVPDGDEPDAFYVEYVLQLDVGEFPGFLTGPVIIETIKSLFRYADKFFRSGYEEGGELHGRLAARNTALEAAAAEVEAAAMDEREMNGEGDEGVDSTVLDQKIALLMPP